MPMGVFIATAAVVAVVLYLALRFTFGIKNVRVTIGTFVLFILGLGVEWLALPDDASADVRAVVTGIVIGVLVIHLYAFAGIMGNLGKRI